MGFLLPNYAAFLSSTLKQLLKSLKQHRAETGINKAFQHAIKNIFCYVDESKFVPKRNFTVTIFHKPF